VTELFAHIFKKGDGVRHRGVREERIVFAAVGIVNYHWKRTPLGVVDTEGGLLPADRGSDQARAVVPQEAVGREAPSCLRVIKESLTPRIAAGEGFQYGYFLVALPPYGKARPNAWVARGFWWHGSSFFPDEQLIRDLHRLAHPRRCLDRVRMCQAAACRAFHPQQCARPRS